MGKLFAVVAVLCMVSLVAFVVYSVQQWYDLKVGCMDLLKLAANAPDVPAAHGFLSQALEYIEANGLTEGNSAYFFHTQKNDVGIWHRQLVGAKATLETILQRKAVGNESIVQLGKDNALMKLREVLMDGTTVTVPDNLAWFPNQQLVLLWWVATVAGCLVIFLLAIS